MRLQPIKRSSAIDAVIEALQRHVASSGLAAGDRLPPERDLAAQLGVGRSSIREAMRQWEALGVVRRRPGAGTFLARALHEDTIHLPLTFRLRPEELLRGLAVRRALEREVAGLAAAHATPRQIEEIGRRLEVMEAVHLANGSAPEEDRLYHRAIYEAVDNPLFMQILDSLRVVFDSFFAVASGRPSFAARSFPFHRLLFEAIRDRDPVRARAMSDAILDIVEEDLKSAQHAAPA